MTKPIFDVLECVGCGQSSVFVNDHNVAMGQLRRLISQAMKDARNECLSNEQINERVLDLIKEAEDERTS